MQKKKFLFPFNFLYPKYTFITFFLHLSYFLVSSYLIPISFLNPYFKMTLNTFKLDKIALINAKCILVSSYNFSHQKHILLFLYTLHIEFFLFLIVLITYINQNFKILNNLNFCEQRGSKLFELFVTYQHFMTIYFTIFRHCEKSYS